MSRKLTESDIQDRLEYGRRVGWDKFKFAERFGCKPSSAVQFKSKYGSRHDREIFRRTEKGKDEDEEPDRQDGYDNRPLFDLCVLTEDEYLFKVMLNEEQTAYIYQRAKEAGNITCSQVIAKAVNKQLPKKPDWFEVDGKFYSQCGICGEWFGSTTPNYCHRCGQAIDQNEHFDEASE